ncbi:hypothetical protein GPL15_17485 [Clostridium sp. MCC353]|uniref:hypothetical protein n=1 Tax=Clostridium sp. MCC353 TaxID=2592646 RepID=UPI001C011100|nr:hypothetical protein [Clostridium sp. MCC353]MBT9778294.1 hypothetical protein [Clostridium sp. MCC353]
MKNWKIKTKKDRAVCLICLTLLVYAVVNGCFRDKIMRFMERFMPDKLTVMNQPGGYGTLIVTTIVMTLFLLVYEIIGKKKIKMLWITACSGILLSTALFGGYYLHGWLLVRQVYTTPAVSAWIHYHGASINLKAGDERLLKLQELASGMERLPKEEQLLLRSEDHGNSGRMDMVWINFPYRYFHSYDLIFRINEDGTVYIGNGPKAANYYDDNGVIEFLRTEAEGA